MKGISDNDSCNNYVILSSVWQLIKNLRIWNFVRISPYLGRFSKIELTCWRKSGNPWILRSHFHKRPCTKRKSLSRKQKTSLNLTAKRCENLLIKHDRKELRPTPKSVFKLQPSGQQKKRRKKSHKILKIVLILLLKEINFLGNLLQRGNNLFSTIPRICCCIITQILWCNYHGEKQQQFSSGYLSFNYFVIIKWINWNHIKFSYLVLWRKWIDFLGNN